MATNISCMHVNEKLDRTNYNFWSLKVQFLLNKGDMVEFLTASMFPPAERDEHENDVTATEQYKEKLRHTKPVSKGTAVLTLQTIVMHA